MIDAEWVTLAVATVLGFVAGFSEKFVLGAVAKVAGSGSEDPSSPRPMMVGELLKPDRQKPDPADEEVDAADQARGSQAKSVRSTPSNQGQETDAGREPI